MDGISAAASILGIATAGVQVSIKLATLSSQISTAPDRLSAIGNNVSLTSAVLQQLADLMKSDSQSANTSPSILSNGSLNTVQASASVCDRIFLEVKDETSKASIQLRDYKHLLGNKVKLSKIERLKWPFLQPSIDVLRNDLKEAKGTLILMLQLCLLGISKRIANPCACPP